MGMPRAVHLQRRAADLRHGLRAQGRRTVRRSAWAWQLRMLLDQRFLLLLRDRDASGASPSFRFCTSGARTQPEKIALQVMPVLAVSSSTTLVRPSNPCLAAT